MLILHTTLFHPQTDNLNEIDLAAAWAILNAIKTPQMIIYNCGVESGSSQGHKHLQIFPRQDRKNLSMWPSKVEDTDGFFSLPDCRSVLLKFSVQESQPTFPASHSSISSSVSQNLPHLTTSTRNTSAYSKKPNGPYETPAPGLITI